MLLINGTSGIAVGMASNIPPHNLNEVLDGLEALIANPEITVDELTQFIKGPDFPTAGEIHGVAGIDRLMLPAKARLQFVLERISRSMGLEAQRNESLLRRYPSRLTSRDSSKKLRTLLETKSSRGSATFAMSPQKMRFELL